VLGWNTVWDWRRGLAYTASTRAWIDPKFGGYGVWQIDGFLHTVLAAQLGESWLAQASSPRLSIGPAGTVLLTSAAADGLARGLAGLLLVVRDAQQAGTWTRLKACRNPECHWAFYDRSHAHRGAWCDMATCGNMIKNRNFRARHKT
jgi:predicted RNA-binding Zn ribbon-like protein